MFYALISMHNSFGLNKINTKINTNEIRSFSQNELLLTALEYHKIGKISEAEYLYRFFIDKGYKHPTVFTNYAIILTDKNSHDEAKTLFLESIKLNPDNFATYINFANCLLKSGKYPEARNCVKTAIKLNPNSCEAHNNLGLIYLTLKQYNDAETSLLKAVYLNTTFAEAHLSGLLTGRPDD